MTTENQKRLEAREAFFTFLSELPTEQAPLVESIAMESAIAATKAKDSEIGYGQTAFWEFGLECAQEVVRMAKAFYTEFNRRRFSRRMLKARQAEDEGTTTNTGAKKTTKKAASKKSAEAQAAA